jgi:hypothetical protein
MLLKTQLQLTLLMQAPNQVVMLARELKTLMMKLVRPMTILVMTEMTGELTKTPTMLQ